MTDYTWPNGLLPFASSFYLQPHTGGTQSPFTLQTKVYGLSKPIWACSLLLRASRSLAQGDGQGIAGPKMDALLAKLAGRENRIALWDFDYPTPRGGLAGATGNVAASRGDTQITVTGMTPGATVGAGGYIGGDGRPHLITDDVIVDGSGHALVKFWPALETNIALNAAIFTKVTGMFRLTGDDQSNNFSEKGQLAQYSLQLLEDPGPTVDVTFAGDIVTYSH